MYGSAATYDSIEGQFRKIRKEAESMKSEVEKGERPIAPPRGNSSVKKEGRADDSNNDDVDAEGNDDDDVTPTKKKPARKPRTPAKSATPGKSSSAANGVVMSGRVSKNSTPTKGKNIVKGVKEEVESSGESMFEGMVEMSQTSGFGENQGYGWSPGYGGLGMDLDGPEA